MKIAVVTVLYDRHWSLDSADVDARIALAVQVLAHAAGARLVVFPAGFLVVARVGDRLDAARRMSPAAQTTKAAIVWGVDVRAHGARSSKHEGAADRDRDPRMLNFLYLRRSDGTAALWDVRQLAYRSTQAVRADRLPKDRIVSLAGRSVGVLVCGEMLAGVYGRGRSLNKVREVVAEADLVIDSAHADVPVRGLTRWLPAIEHCSAATRPRRSVVVAQHLSVALLAGRRCGVRGDVPCVGSRAALHRHVDRRRVGQLAGGRHPAAVVDMYDVP